MARAGRKRKSGDRYPSGDLRRAPDRGTPELRLQRALGTGLLTSDQSKLWANGNAKDAAEGLSTSARHGVDAVGRAHVAGFLQHPDKTGDQLVDAGRLLFKLYWAHYSDLRGMAVSSFYRALVSGGAIRGGASDDGGRWERIEEALNVRLSMLDKCGRDVRGAVTSLCIDQHFDAGPAWLDRLIAAKTPGRAKLRADSPEVEWRWPQDAFLAGADVASFNQMHHAVIGLAAIA
ncbi:hypothetical protein [Rhizorhabdus wittichii]|uniref:hypothetical protein n=1 Tax=Rhizorhabdus wittichii TaxID=160791 RepID=UPI0002F52BCE|nr:hypothetical protein [Rhizorhabdus wittichii]